MAKRIETVITSFAHALGAMGVGSLVEYAFGKFAPEADYKNDLADGALLAGQLAVSTLIMAEFAAAFVPSSDLYVSPIGDGIMTYFLFESQPLFRKRMKQLLHRVLSQFDSRVSQPPSAAAASETAQNS